MKRGLLYVLPVVLAVLVVWLFTGGQERSGSPASPAIAVPAAGDVAVPVSATGP